MIQHTTMLRLFTWKSLFHQFLQVLSTLPYEIFPYSFITVYTARDTDHYMYSVTVTLTKGIKLGFPCFEASYAKLPTTVAPRYNATRYNANRL